MPKPSTSSMALSLAQAIGWPASTRWSVQRAAPATNRSLTAGPQRGARHRRARRCQAPKRVNRRRVEV